MKCLALYFMLFIAPNRNSTEYRNLPLYSFFFALFPPLPPLFEHYFWMILVTVARFFFLICDLCTAFDLSCCHYLPSGPTVTFAVDVSPLRILPPVGFIRAPSGRFSAVLVLDKPAEDLVDVTCSIDVLPRGTDLQNTSGVCSTPSKDKVTFANSTVELNKKDIQFQVSYTFFKSFEKIPSSWTNVDIHVSYLYSWILGRF